MSIWKNSLSFYKLIELSNYKHQKDISVRYMDFDAMHHVNNARYLNFLEEARISYCQEVLDLFLELNQFNVFVARIEIDYLKPIQFNSELRVYTRVFKIGNKSFSFESIICIRRKGEEPLPVAKSVQVMVSVDASNGRAVEIPDSIKKKIEDFEHSL